jgi:hypothetical protein
MKNNANIELRVKQKKEPSKLKKPPNNSIAQDFNRMTDLLLPQLKNEHEEQYKKILKNKLGSKAIETEEAEETCETRSDTPITKMDNPQEAKTIWKTSP